MGAVGFGLVLGGVVADLPGRAEDHLPGRTGALKRDGEAGAESALRLALELVRAGTFDSQVPAGVVQKGHRTFARGGSGVYQSDVKVVVSSGVNVDDGALECGDGSDQNGQAGGSSAPLLAAEIGPSVGSARRSEPGRRRRDRRGSRHRRRTNTA